MNENLRQLYNTVHITDSISGKVLGHHTQIMWITSKKNPLLINNTCSTHTHICMLKRLCQWNWYKDHFSLDFELHKWRQMFIYLLEQMVNPLIFELICLLCRLFRILEMLFDLTFWLRLYFFVIYTLNLFII